MNKFILKKYIQNLTLNDIYTIGTKQNIYLNNTELSKIHKYIKNNYQNYFNNKLSKEEILIDAKSILTINNYKTLIILYDKYKDKI
ncbi:MAG: hypothetical protein IKF19_04695 [Bacilli bacterium]|nr:hypothetical protein [Bacilli bacterium]